MEHCGRSKCIIKDINSISKNPHCEHGPSVLFERTLTSGVVKKFYACSAFRTRKLCSFYLSYEERKKKCIKNFTSLETLRYQKHCENFSRLKELKTNMFQYCHNCSIVFKKQEAKEHSQCDIVKLSHDMLQQPSRFLAAKDVSKGEAQFFFTSKSVSTIVDNLASLQMSNLICLGTPTFHQVFRNSENTRSMLLDIDNRFCNFFSPEEFQMYNMFNNHFLHGVNGKAKFLSFLEGCDKITLIVDPPFGGRLELLSKSISDIEKQWQNINNTHSTLSVILILPYFLEKSVKKCFVDLSMLEYQINYENHPVYSKGKKDKNRVSPVRIFTNIGGRVFRLPRDEGYRFCALCQRFVHSQNAHCRICADCTSKDGRRFVHCNKCGVCVKPNRAHCGECERCLPPGHRCLSRTDQSAARDAESETLQRMPETSFEETQKGANYRKRKRKDNRLKRKKKKM